MLAVIHSAALIGIDSQLVRIEVDISGGLPSFCMVGLPDGAVKESRERVFSALKNSGYEIPSQKTTINLAPADLRKVGTSFDLPIAVGMLLASKQLDLGNIHPFLFAGELSLDGGVYGIKGALASAMFAKSNGYSGFVFPRENWAEASAVENLPLYPIKHLKELPNLFLDKPSIAPIKSRLPNSIASGASFDFSQIKGQKEAKRALEVAAAGGHNILFIGSPGCGKTMLAKSLPGILPDMTAEERLVTTMVYSAAGNLTSPLGLMTFRPFRSPHHTISNVALVGGGNIPKPGEVSLSHNGVLFLDELAEFKKSVLEGLRQPLEEGRVTLNRNFQTITFPSQSILVGAMNPCPCGNLLDPKKNCVCRTNDIKKYLAKVSGPLLDRIDIQIELSPLNFEELTSTQIPESSESIRKRVSHTRKIQWERFREEKSISHNGQMNLDHLKKYCALNIQARKMLEDVVCHFGLSARAYHRIIKLSRTIADLEGMKDIQDVHVAEAIHYRSLDRTRREFC